MFQRQALVIGNSDYQLKHRTACVNDANDMCYTLRSIGFLTHCAINMEHVSLESRIQRFTESIEPNAIVIFYFSGLSVQYDGNNYLIPIDNDDINTDNLKSVAINVEEFIENMHNKSPRAVIVILDCSRPYRKLITLRPFFDRETLGLMHGLAPVRPPPSTIVAYSCAIGATSSAISSNGRNSIFTYYLLRYITTPNVDILTVLKNVALAVQRDTHNKQMPIRYSSVHENICLVGNTYQNNPAWYYGKSPDLSFHVKDYRSRRESSVISRSQPQINHFQQQFIDPFVVPKRHRSARFLLPSRTMRSGFPFPK